MTSFSHFRQRWFSATSVSLVALWAFAAQLPASVRAQQPAEAESAKPAAATPAPAAAATTEPAKTAASDSARPSVPNVASAAAPTSTSPSPAAPKESPNGPATATGEELAKKLVRLEFQEQKWLPVLQWLAAQRHLNLDWQKLPDGVLNLASSKEYTLEEAEDLINMQLLARGFTLLQGGEVLRLVPLKDIDITLVPRVTADELAKLPLHRYVRCTFPLDWMLADEAAKELKPLISPYGQIFPMATSNRLEAMDAVVNLREVNKLLNRAETDESRLERVAVFQLKHRKAEEVAVQVRQLLGLPPDRGRQTPDIQTQRDIEQFKFQAEAVKQLGANAPQFLKEKPDVYLAVNTEENSILVNGQPDKIEIVRQAVEAMDKPEPPRESAWETFNRVKVYPLNGIDPSSVTQMMQTIQRAGNVDEDTRITLDSAYNRLIVFASPEDQVTIAGILETFRSEERRAEVINLSHIDADYAKKAITLILMGPNRPALAPGAPSDGRFQIEPDPSHNRLLLWATPKETKEVREFLAGLGETSNGMQAVPQLHIVPLRGAKATVVAERLKRVWKDISDAPLVIESAKPGETSPDTTPPPSAPANQTTPAPTPAEKPQPMSERVATVTKVQLASQQTPVPVAAPPQEPKEPKPVPAESPHAAKAESPVHVIADKEDEVIIMSRDAAAADMAKQFIEQVVPGTSDVQVIPLKHAQAAVVKTTIETMLAHTRAAQYSPLSTAEPLVIEADSRINRLMVQHATPEQLRIINSVVPLIDQPEQGEDRLVRKQQIYRAKRKRASEIATVVKDVYRDLLSTSDKVFDARQGYRPYGYNQAMAATSKSPEYAGLLSIGVDDTGNTLVLSAPLYLIDEVMEVVKLVDETADNEKVAVISVTKAAKPTISDTLNRLLNKR